MGMPDLKFTQLVGLAGVSSHEAPLAREWGRRLELPMLLIAILIPIQWYAIETSLVSPEVSHLLDWIIWLFFLGETVLLAFLVNNPAHYLLTNWMNPVIILAGFPIVWNNTPLVGILRNLRLLLLVVLALGLSKTLRRFLMRNRLGTTLGIALGVVVISGILITRIEPPMGNIWDGIWWAWVTVFTVGYGDIAPKSHSGRLFAGMLILFGVGLISLLTANLAAFLIGSEVEKVEKEEKEADVLLKDLAVRMERIERLLEQNQQRGGKANTQDVPLD